jgi:hypothetical protein
MPALIGSEQTKFCEPTISPNWPFALSLQSIRILSFSLSGVVRCVQLNRRERGRGGGQEHPSSNESKESRYGFNAGRYAH